MASGDPLWKKRDANRLATDFSGENRHLRVLLYITCDAVDVPKIASVKGSVKTKTYVAPLARFVAVP